jgi:hypothetical protein
MGHNNFHHDIELPGESDTPPASDSSCPTLVTRLQARFLGGRLDRDIEAGILPEPGSALALHMVRLTSVAEREALARSLRHALSDPCDTGRVVPMRVPVHPQRVAACHDVIDDITLLLHCPRPVRARGMARLRMLLSDGRGPLYRYGRGSLAAELRGVLAAL